jgi:hypothetical protein
MLFGLAFGILFLIKFNSETILSHHLFKFCVHSTECDLKNGVEVSALSEFLKVGLK